MKSNWKEKKLHTSNPNTLTHILVPSTHTAHWWRIGVVGMSIYKKNGEEIIWMMKKLREAKEKKPSPATVEAEKKNTEMHFNESVFSTRFFGHRNKKKSKRLASLQSDRKTKDFFFWSHTQPNLIWIIDNENNSSNWCWSSILLRAQHPL